MKNAFIRMAGFVLSRKPVRELLLKVAQRDPDMHIMSPDGKDVYMFRWWLFNRITDQKRKYPWIKFSARIHLVARKDLDRHLHDHPWNARVFMLDGGYDEIRLEGWHATSTLNDEHWLHDYHRRYIRQRGDSYTLGFEQYHRIDRLHSSSSLSLFVFGDYQGTWGFRVQGKKVPYRDYLAQKAPKPSVGLKAPPKSLAEVPAPHGRTRRQDMLALALELKEMGHIRAVKNMITSVGGEYKIADIPDNRIESMIVALDAFRLGVKK